MKLKDLFEGPPPVFDPKEMPILVGMTTRFYSEKSLNDIFELPIAKFKLDEQDFFVFISKEKDMAIVASPAVREEDKSVGANVKVRVDFKNPINITYDRAVKYDKNKVLQIDGVEVLNSKDKRNGLGFYLYLSLIKAGFVIVSDNYQYIGGKELWKKIVRLSEFDMGFSVYVIENGNPRLDADGNLVKIKSIDIENEDEFWSDKKGEKYHTLFLAKLD